MNDKEHEYCGTRVQVSNAIDYCMIVIHYIKLISFLYHIILENLSVAVKPESEREIQ